MNKRRRPLRTVTALVDAGLAPAERREALDRVAARYAIAITPHLAGLIGRDGADDPIGRQFLPEGSELETQQGERADPIGDGAHEAVPGLVHRYRDRVLFKLVSVCPAYCRFCFRRAMLGPGHGTALSKKHLAAALDYIRADTDIWEVILSGGDPLILSPPRIGEITAALARIPHVKVLRWHTRVPVVAPELVTAELVAALRSPSQATYVALHANHARELTAAARSACARLIEAGIVMVSQTVLLKGVNDDPDTLEALMRALVETRVKPYYLHHLDPAPGTSHFRTTIATGRRLARALRRRMSGLAQPTYVLDIPGGYGKVPIGPEYLSRAGELAPYDVEDIHGQRHSYVDADEAHDADRC